MRIWREIMDDKLLGGVLGLLLLVSFAFQIAGASRAAAAMISPDPLSILCSSEGAAHRPAPSDHQRLCPCAELCAAGLHIGTTPAPSDASGIPIRFADRIEISVDPSAGSPSGFVERRYEARGPPGLQA